jgi:hypothetical protein
LAYKEKNARSSSRIGTVSKKANSTGRRRLSKTRGFRAGLEPRLAAETQIYQFRFSNCNEQRLNTSPRHWPIRRRSTTGYKERRPHYCRQPRNTPPRPYEVQTVKGCGDINRGLRLHTGKHPTNGNAVSRHRQIDGSQRRWACRRQSRHRPYVPRNMPALTKLPNTWRGGSETLHCAQSTS